MGVTATGDDVSCIGETDGQITVQGTGGIDGYVSGYVLRDPSNQAIAIYSMPVNNPNQTYTFTPENTGQPIGPGTYTIEYDQSISGVAVCQATTTVTIGTDLDNEPPVFSNCPGNITVNSDTGVCSATVDYSYTVSDNCDTDTVEITDGLPANSDFPVGTTSVTITATDSSGNSTDCTFTVTVVDNEAPLITREANDLAVECGNPDNTTLFNAWLNANGGATATDNCSFVWTNDFNALSDLCGETGSATVTFTATDPAGNASSTQATFTIEDNTAPSIDLAAADVSVECDGSGNTDGLNLWLSTQGGAIASDTCGGVTWSNNYSALSDDCGATGSATVTFTATDDCGNTSTTSATFTIEDTTPPTITAPANITIQCNEDQDDTGVTGVPTNISETCSGVSVGSSDVITAGSCPGNYTITRTWTATDECGNDVSADQIITVQDTTDPVLTVPANETVECSDDTSTTATGTATATDNCDAAPVVTFNDVITAGNCAGNYTITRTWTATDECGNDVSADQIITVQDTTPPSIVPPADIAIECGVSDPNALQDWLASNGGATATDNCTSVNDIVWTNNFTTQNVDVNCSNGSIEITFTATDACGNSASSTASYSIIDTIDPILTIPANITVECDEDTSTASTGIATATDDCSTPSVSFTDVVTAGNCPSNYIITRTWSTSDGCNTVTENQIITVQDTTAPILTGQGADADVECPEDLVFTAPTATDNCTPIENIVITFVDTENTDNCGLIATTRTWTATDCAGNASATVSQTLTYVDTTAPVLAGQGADADVECPEDLVFTAPTATDTCSAATSEPTITFVDTETLSDCGLPVITRTWTATDCAGNVSSSVSQTLTYVDTTPPTVVTPFDANINVTCDAIPSVPSLDFTDTCAQDVTVVFVETSTQTGNNSDYVITRTWTVSDGCNETTFIQIINVSLPNISATNAEFCIGDDIDFDLFNALNADVDTSGTWTVTFGNATIDGSIFNPTTVANNDGDNNPNTFNPEDLGDYIFTYTLDDDCDTSVDVTITLNGDCIVLACGRDDVNISNTVTANGDGVNEFFEVTGVETCGFVTEVQIFNRWGAVVYKNNNYQNDWSGQAIRSAAGNASTVPTGTYYYVITLRNSGLEPFAGPIYMVTGN